MIKTHLLKLFASIKNYLVLSFSVIASFLAPIQGLIFLSFILCLMDFMFKIILVARAEGWSAIESKKMGDTGYKMAFYCALIILLQLIHNLFFVDFGHSILTVMFDETTVTNLMKLNVASVGAFLIIVREVKSIDENWESFSGWSFIETVSGKFSWIFKFKNNETNAK